MSFFTLLIGTNNNSERTKDTSKRVKISLASASANTAPGDWCAPMPWFQCSLAGNIYMHYKLWENPNLTGDKLK